MLQVEPGRLSLRSLVLGRCCSRLARSPRVAYFLGGTHACVPLVVCVRSPELQRISLSVLCFSQNARMHTVSVCLFSFQAPTNVPLSRFWFSRVLPCLGLTTQEMVLGVVGTFKDHRSLARTLQDSEHIARKLGLIVMGVILFILFVSAS